MCLKVHTTITTSTTINCSETGGHRVILALLPVIGDALAKSDPINR